jgi:hypothetical protein
VVHSIAFLVSSLFRVSVLYPFVPSLLTASARLRAVFCIPFMLPLKAALRVSLLSADFLLLFYGSLRGPLRFPFKLQLQIEIQGQLLPYSGFTLHPTGSLRGHAVAQLVEALCYKSEGREFNSR